VTATKWKINSNQYIDVDIYKIINDHIKTLDLVATSVEEEEIFIYELVFHASKDIRTVRRMFPNCNVSPIPMKKINRVLVYYDEEDNCYRPYCNPDM